MREYLESGGKRKELVIDLRQFMDAINSIKNQRNE
jgi:hypothetical protein